MIDQKKINKNIKLPLNKSNENDKYYILSCDWLKEYLRIYNLNELYYNQIINRILENIINSIQNNALNETIFNNANLPPEFKNIINQIKVNNLANDYLNNISTTPTKININKISFYCDFILISGETKKKIFNKKSELLYFITKFGDNKIFATINAPSEYIINVYNLENNNFIPEIFYHFNDVNGLMNSFKILNEKGYENFTNCYIIFNDSVNQKDYASPIFNDNNKEIGYAYRYSRNINDYSHFKINNEYKNMLKLYYYYISLRSLTLSRTKKSYYLVNSEFMNRIKEHYDFSIFSKDFQQNNLFHQIGKNISDAPTKMKDILSDKMITLIIKQSPLYINQNFNSKGKVNLNGLQDDPKLSIDPNKTLYFYDEFELIDYEMYLLLFKSHNNNGISRECNFIDGYIYFKLPGNLNKTNNSYIIEFGSLNNNNVFKAKYLLEFNSENAFIYCLKLSNQLGGFSTYINSIEFKNNIEQLYDIDTNKPIGLIYNLNLQTQPQPGPTPIPNPGRTPKPIPPPPIPGTFTDILQEFKSPPLIGLKNVGATCYMNATLQCLSQIRKLTNYFKYKPSVDVTINNFGNQPCLTKSFKELIENLWPSKDNIYLDNKHSGKNSNNRYYAPSKFKKTISSMNSLFEGVAANDAKDLVNFIIMTLHEELNKKKGKKQPVPNIILNQNDQNQIFQAFFLNFMNENQSIISDIFYGVSHTITKCSGCPFFKHNFEAFFFLIFPLEEVRKFKLNELSALSRNMMNMNMMMNMNNMYIMNKISLLNANQVDILDCFEFNQKAERFFGENAMYCNNCRAQLPSIYKTFLYTAPEILILVLNRGVGIQFKIKLNFPEILDLRAYFEASQMVGGIYELIGVVTHMGESGSSGHFVATCKSPRDHKWYQYNDDLVFYQSDFQKQILNYAMPYILFYQKRS
jgi:ubiquitin C-terminal hydrolase